MASAARPAKRIFVSHSSKDNDFGVRLVEDLRRALGGEEAVWYDAAGGLGGGDAWWRKIMTELRARSVFLVILSPDALASPWVNNEIDLAWYQRTTLGNKVIIPVLYRPCVTRDDLEMLQMVSFLEPRPYETALAEVLAAVQRAPDEPAEATAAPSEPVTPAPQPVSVALPSASQTPLAAAPVAQLLSITGAFPARYVLLNQREIAVGRGPANDLLIADPTVSTAHLRLREVGASWRVARVPNAEMVYVNGRAIEEAEVHDGDQITLGTSILRFETPDRPPVQASAGQPARRLAVDCPGYPCHFVAPLREPVITIGRSPECAITLPSPIVSLRHAELRRGPDGAYTILDTGSRNGLTLRGQRVQAARLNNGDALIIGSPAQQDYVTLTYTEM